MPRLTLTAMDDVLPLLPSIRELTVGSVAQHEESLFLCALGFESRSLTLPQLLASAGYKARRSGYFRYATNPQENEANLNDLRSALTSVSDAVEPIESDGLTFDTQLRSLIKAATDSDLAPPTVTLDVSGLANRVVLRCMKVILEYDVRLRLIYAEAATYRPTKEEYEANPSLWRSDESLGLERGVGDLTPSIDHPGYGYDTVPDALILFPSFKAERSKAVISYIDPSLLNNPGNKVVWLVGQPHLEADAWRIDAMREINEFGADAKWRLVSTFDYRDSLSALETTYLQLRDRYRVSLAPFGSKMQAIGASLFCYLHPDVRVILATPKEYNASQYSEGCKGVWEVDFGLTSKLRAQLDRVGSLVIVDD
jgi:hypothetical protein